MNIINKQHINLSSSVFATLMLAAVIVTTGCSEEGPAEKSGKKLDQAIERTNEKIEERAEDLKENLESKEEAIKEDIEAKQKAMEQQSETVGEYIDDAAITAKVKAAMVADPLVSAFNIEVATVQGLVKLNGVVDSQQTIDRTLEIVRATPGVKSLESYLVVGSGEVR